MVDTLGREVMVVKQIELDERGWPQHGADTRITSGSEVRATHAHLTCTPCKQSSPATEQYVPPFAASSGGTNDDVEVICTCKSLRMPQRCTRTVIAIGDHRQHHQKHPGPRTNAGEQMQKW